MPKLSADQLPTLAEWNSRYIDYVLNFTKGKKTAAARILGINRRTLYRRNKAKGRDASHDGMNGDRPGAMVHQAMSRPEPQPHHMEH